MEEIRRIVERRKECLLIWSEEDLEEYMRVKRMVKRIVGEKLDGKELIRENDTEVRWREYFVHWLNDKEINEVGGNTRRARIGGNERVVRKVVRKKRYRLKCVYIRAKRREMNSLERRRIRIYIWKQEDVFEGGD